MIEIKPIPAGKYIVRIKVEILTPGKDYGRTVYGPICEIEIGQELIHNNGTAIINTVILDQLGL